MFNQCLHKGKYFKDGAKPVQLCYLKKRQTRRKQITKSIPIKRGMRERDVISPILFTLAAKIAFRTMD